jgi:hypothetical protein
MRWRAVEQQFHYFQRSFDSGSDDRTLCSARIRDRWN